MVRQCLRPAVSAIQFLTTLPVPEWATTASTASSGGSWTRDNLARSTRWYPLAGLMVGSGLAAVEALTAQWMGLPAEWTALAVVTTGFVLTGGLHLDGWADVWDAWWSRRSQTGMREIMHDSRLGTMGAAGVVIALLALFLLVSDLTASGRAVLPLLAAAVASRAILPLTMCLFPTRSAADAAHPGGLAAQVSEGLNGRDATGSAGGGILIIALLTGVQGLLFTGAAWLLALTAAWLCQRKFGAVTGDVLGALQILTVITLLFFWNVFP